MSPGNKECRLYVARCCGPSRLAPSKCCPYRLLCCAHRQAVHIACSTCNALGVHSIALCWVRLRVRVQHRYIPHTLTFLSELACRTLHTAEDAADGFEKWIFQLWVCTGLQRRPPVNAVQAAAQQLAAARKPAQSKAKRPNKKKR